MASLVAMKYLVERYRKPRLRLKPQVWTDKNLPLQSTVVENRLGGNDFLQLLGNDFLTVSGSFRLLADQYENITVPAALPLSRQLWQRVFPSPPTPRFPAQCVW
jgi:hypothetical protein